MFWQKLLVIWQRNSLTTWCASPILLTSFFWILCVSFWRYQFSIAKLFPISFVVVTDFTWFAVSENHSRFRCSQKTCTVRVTSQNGMSNAYLLVTLNNDVSFLSYLGNDRLSIGRTLWWDASCHSFVEYTSNFLLIFHFLSFFSVHKLIKQKIICENCFAFRSFKVVFRTEQMYFAA